jgi:hypothetical protein
LIDLQQFRFNSSRTAIFSLILNKIVAFNPFNLKSILKREIIQTLDGSTTIQIAEWNECYHSKHGNSGGTARIY